MVFANSLVPNRHQAICKHHDDWTAIIVSSGSLGYWTPAIILSATVRSPTVYILQIIHAHHAGQSTLSDSHWLEQIDMAACLVIYRKISTIRCTLVGNKIVDHSDVVGASPVGAAPTTSSFSTQHLASRDSTKTATRRYENLLTVGIWCGLY